MADVKTFIWHDEKGRITAVGHVPFSGGKSIEPRAKSGQKVLEASMDERHLPTLHLTHCVDVARGIVYARETKG